MNPMRMKPVHVARLVVFWVVAFAVIIWKSARGHEWHTVHVNFHMGDEKGGKPIRRQYMARKTVDGLKLEWRGFGRPPHEPDAKDL